MKTDQIKEENNSKPKRYRLVNGNGYTTLSHGAIYFETDKAAMKGNTIVADLVEAFPNDWELVTDEPEPFKPTHEINTGLLRNEPVVLIKKDGNLCRVEDEHGIRYLVSTDDLTELETQTTLTDQQYTSLVKSIYNVIMNSNDELGMADMGECELLAENTVKTWMEQNNIKLP